MKKIISVFLLICMLTSWGFSSALSAVAAPTHGYLLGDANDDGELTLKDVLLVRRFVAGVIGEKDIDFIAADTNSDETVTLGDVLTMRKAVAGVLTLDGNNTDKMYNVDRIMIGERNIARYTIVVGDASNECMKYSATELSKYIELACGVALNITTDEDSVSGYKIKYQFDSDDLYGLGLEGYRVAVEENGDVSFYCGAARGPLYVTYFFLEEVVGWRFLMGDYRHDKEYDYNQLCDFVKYLYESECVTMESTFDVTEVPSYSYRGISQSGSVYGNFPMLRLNAVDANGSRACTYARYGYGVGSTVAHAHSYALYQAGWGNPVPDNYHHIQPCLSEEEIYNNAIEYILNYLEEKASRGKYFMQEYTQVSCSPNDNINFCECSSCKKIYEEEGSIAGAVFRLSNRVAETIDKYYPGIEVYTVAYWDARNPPKMTRPLSNVSVMFCIGGCNNHTLMHTDECYEAGGNERLLDPSGFNSSNYADINYYNMWTEITDNITVWYYSENFTYNLAPSPNIHNVYEDFKYLAEHGCTGVYSEGTFEHSYCFEDLRGYLTAKMLWNASMTEEEFNELMNEYLMIYYGDGWRYIRQYIDMADECANLNGCWTNNYDRPWNIYNEEYIREHYDEMRELFVKALSYELTDEQRYRLEVCSLQIDFLGLSATYESKYLNGTAEEKQIYAERYAYLVNHVIEKGIEVVSFEPELPGGCKNFAKDANDIRNPMDWIGAGFTGYWVWNGERWV